MEGDQINASIFNDPVFQPKPKAKGPQLTSRQKMERELAKMQEADDRKKEKFELAFKEETKKNKLALEKERKDKGIQFYSGTIETKAAIQKIVSAEEQLAMEKTKEKLKQETDKLQEEIDFKFGIQLKKEHPDMAVLVKNAFTHPNPNAPIPERITKQLTEHEIRDLKEIFSLFDVKNRGYITPKDVERLAKMLGFRAPKDIFEGMMEEVSDKSKNKVTFINFLDFIIKSQGEGPDPFEEIQQCFKLMDKDNKGYLTVDDLRELSEETKVCLSNGMIKEMFQEADRSGDGKVTLEDLF